MHGEISRINRGPIVKVVFTNGCFDILHRGHIELLKFCKSIGDEVIVGLNSDSSVKKLKGKSRPINACEDREALLRSIKFVDDVIVFEDDTPLNIIEKIKPDVIVKGGDYNIEEVVGNKVSKVIIFNYIDGYSTTGLIGNLTSE